MSLWSQFRRATIWVFVVAGFARASVMAQTPSPEGSERQPSDYRHPLRTWTRTERSSVPERPRSDPTLHAKVAGKLQSIVIPRIEFRNTTLSDAVEYLRQESRRLDPDPNPDARGVNIVLRLPGPTSPKTPQSPPIPGLPTADASAQTLPKPETRITLTMERLPLLEALRYVALQAGVKLAIEPDGVAIVPLNSGGTPALTTREYKIAPESVGLLPGAGRRVPGDEDISSPGPPIRRIDMVPWLKARGVNFPEGTSATYLPFSGKLVVRNTQENLDIIGAIISSAREAPTPQNP